MCLGWVRWVGLGLAAIARVVRRERNVVLRDEAALPLGEVFTDHHQLLLGYLQKQLCVGPDSLWSVIWGRLLLNCWLHV